MFLSRIKIFIVTWVFSVFAFHGALAQEADSNYSDAFGLYKAGQLKAAMESVELALEDNPKSIDALELKGEILLAQAKPNDAAEVFNKELEIDPKHVSAFYHLGDAAFAERMWPDAIGCYGKFLSTTKDDPKDGLLKLVYCYVAMRDFAEAGKILTGLDPLDKAHPGYFFGKSALDRALGKTEDADELLQRAQAYHGFKMYQEYLKDYVWIFKKEVQAGSPLKSAK